MQFNTYLKSCRQHSGLSQEALVEKLFHGSDTFKGLDAGTISRWERGVTRPSLTRQAEIIRAFQEHSGLVFLCFERSDPDAIQEEICKVGISRIIGKNRELVLNFPEDYVQFDQFKIIHLRHTSTIDHTIKIALSLDKEFTNAYSQLGEEHFRTWALHPSSLFLVCEHDSIFFGLLFTLRLTPETFERLMAFEIEEKDLDIGDFADFDSPGCNYILNFFAQSPKSASLLFLRYYAHLIANQTRILDVGALTMMDEGRKLIERLHLDHHRDTVIDGHRLSSYKAPLDKVLINPSVLKMVFQKQSCPEDGG